MSFIPLASSSDRETNHVHDSFQRDEVGLMNEHIPTETAVQLFTGRQTVVRYNDELDLFEPQRAGSRLGSRYGLWFAINGHDAAGFADGFGQQQRDIAGAAAKLTALN